MASFFSGLNKMLNAGAAYVQHLNFINQAVEAQQVDSLLAQYAQSLTDASFSGFKVTLSMAIANETNAARKSRMQRMLEHADAARNGTSAPTTEAEPPTDPENAFQRDVQLMNHWFANLDDESRPEALAQHVFALPPHGYGRWMANLGQMATNIAAQIQSHKENEDRFGGHYIEDRINYNMMRLRTGHRDPEFMRQLQQLESCQQFVDWLIRGSELMWAERQKEEAKVAKQSSQPATLAPQQKNAGASEKSAASILELVRAFTRTGEYPGGAEQMQKDLPVLIHAGHGEEVMALLQSAGANEGGRKALNSSDYYRPGPNPYELRWPLSMQLPLSFDELDRPTQFNVLFTEWVQREMSGGYALLNGDPSDARTIFEECLERAEQLEVPELIARSHEGLAGVASKVNQRAAERLHLKAAVEARSTV